VIGEIACKYRSYIQGLSFTGDTESPMGKLMLSILGGVAECERAIIRERQREGITVAKGKGVYRGRKSALTADQVAAIRQRAAAGESYYADPLPQSADIDPARPIACVPLRIGARVIGVIAIYRLLTQKERFEPLDFELFTLLAGHAATALFSSKLYQRSEKKLSEIQGFLDLLTAPTPQRAGRS